MCQALADLRQEGRNEGIIRGIVRMCKNFGLGFRETLAYAVKEVSELSPQEVERQVKALW